MNSTASVLFNGLPSAPNVVGWSLWSFHFFTPSHWTSCGWNVTCHWDDHPPLLQPPPATLLPKLSDLNDSDRQERLRYWVGIVLASPVLMALLCEGTRVTARAFKTKRTRYTLANNSGMAGITQQHPFRTGWSSTVAGVILYHSVCATLVAIAAWNGWCSSESRGEFFWEFWALWQQLCLWSLFVQLVMRCMMLEAEALEVGTFTPVLLYTAPFLSELADTMKDWVMAAICLMEAGTCTGFLIGVAMVLLELFSAWTGFTWIPVRISDDLQINVPLSLLKTLYGSLAVAFIIIPVLLWIMDVIIANARFILYSSVVVPATVTWYVIRSAGSMAWIVIQGLFCALVFLVFAVVNVPLLVLGLVKKSLLASVFAFERTCLGEASDFGWYRPRQMFNDTCSFLHTHPLAHGDNVTDSVPEQTSNAHGWMQVIFNILADGKLLFVVSVYVIISSYVQVISHEDSAKDLRRVYRPILDLPLARLRRVGHSLSCFAWIKAEAENVVLDLVSNTRLLIAVAEDIPQGVIGLVLVWKYVLPNGGRISLGFAGLSALVSASKGIFIKLFQTGMQRRQERNVRVGLDSLLSRESLADLLQNTSRLGRSQIAETLDPILREQSENVLRQFNVRDTQLYHPIMSARDEWLNKWQHQLDAVARNLAAIYVEGGATQEDLQNLNYSPMDIARAFGGLETCLKKDLVTLEQIRDVGFTALECRAAGLKLFRIKGCGYTAAEAAAAGFSRQDCVMAVLRQHWKRHFQWKLR